MSRTAAGTSRQAADPSGDGDGRMGILEHLDELRTRLIRACLAIALGMAAALLFIERLAHFVLGSMTAALPPGTELFAGKAGEGLAFYVDIAFIVGFTLAAPFVLFQVWRFVAPGLYRNEKRLVLPVIGLATVGTAGGVLFAQYLLFPSTMAFLLSIDPVPFMLRLEEIFAFYRNTLLVMVAMFQLPTLVFFLARVRAISAGFLLRHVKHAILVSFIAAAFLTGTPDPANQVLMALPMIGLYFVSIGVAWLARPRRGDDVAVSEGLRLVVSATVFEQALRARRGSTRGSHLTLIR